MGVFVYVTDALGLTATQDFIISVAKAPERNFYLLIVLR